MMKKVSCFLSGCFRWSVLVLIVIIVPFGLWLFGGVATAYRWTFASIYFGSVSDLQNVFSPVSALFAGISGFGIVVTIVLQYSQIKDLKLKSEIERFESIFFQMLSIHRENSAKISKIGKKFFYYTNSKCESFDVNSFETIHTALDRVYKTIKNDDKIIPESSDKYKEILVRYCDTNVNFSYALRIAYAIIDSTLMDEMWHYHRHLYNLIFYTHSKMRDDALRSQYMKIIRAQFTAYEHIIIFYNARLFIDSEGKGACRDEDGISFYSLVYKNALLNELNKRLLLDDDHDSLYPIEAYGRAMM